MPQRSSAAKRYAEAIAAIARETGSWEQWRQDLAAIRQAMYDPALRLALENPRLAPERKQELLHRALQDGVADEAINLIAVMVRRGRLELLPDVVQWFDELADRALGIRHVTVTTATPLTDDLRQRIKERLGAGAAQIQLREKVDPDILGGLVVQEGDIIRDYSVRARLESLRERLN
jgi:F-type H+-transporting ATPase subunit delta